MVVALLVGHGGCRARTSPKARGTTSLDRGEPRPARRSAVTGQTRPVLLRRPPGLPFFRRLTGDSRVDAVDYEVTRPGPRSSTRFPDSPQLARVTGLP